MSLRTKMQKLWWMVKNKKKVVNFVTTSLKKELKLKEQIQIIQNSPLFDPDTYRRNNIDLLRVDNLAKHYLVYGGRRREPSEFFCGEEYLTIHADVAHAGMNPLLHYEKHGRNEGREISLLQLNDITFPEEAVALEQSFSICEPHHRRTAILSCFCTGGIIPESLIILLKGLKEVADNIILVGDCVIIPEELDKIKDLVCYAKFERHQQYDFGSYKRSIEYLYNSELLSEEYTEELIMMNDSSYGPVYPFSESFNDMAEEKVDFWGYSGYKSAFYKNHISAYFFVFRRPVVESGYIPEFLSRIEGKYDRGKVIGQLETEFTYYLEERGFKWKVICSIPDISKLPLTYLKEYRIPLVKKKAFKYVPKEDINEVLEIIKENNPHLYDEINYKPFVPHDFKIPTIQEHQASFPDKVAAIAKKSRKGEKINVLFLISNCSLFPSKPLYEAMTKDEKFNPMIAVVPDLRWGGNPVDEMIKQEEILLSEGVPESALVQIRPDDLNRWPDISEDMDIICYNTPYNISSFRYNHRYAVGRSFLPIMVNYGFYRSKYDNYVLALDNYRYMWKAFFECSYTMEQYKENCIDDAENATLVGYIKMDDLAKCTASNTGDRKKILLALHHSITGGSNSILSLANFTRYLNYFVSLPENYPDIDFIYRPHPYLISTLKKPKFWGERRTEAFIEKMRSISNVTWDESDNYFEKFAECDACIQDCGSFLVEYQFTGKPCCYMLKDESDIEEKFVELGKKCLDQCYIAYDTDAIDNFINDVVIAGNDTKAEGREKLRREIMVNYPHAAEAALDDIRKTLGID